MLLAAWLAAGGGRASVFLSFSLFSPCLLLLFISLSLIQFFFFFFFLVPHSGQIFV
uniref:Uncharacterized protein n=1 Tax=Kalanchoe fedtschenkoi TaxID=63787 RepID=A0A7N0SXM5_KALFE